jgi:hypothetical protein
MPRPGSPLPQEEAVAVVLVAALVAAAVVVVAAQPTDGPAPVGRKAGSAVPGAESPLADQMRLRDLDRPTILTG